MITILATKLYVIALRNLLFFSLFATLARSESSISEICISTSLAFLPRPLLPSEAGIIATVKNKTIKKHFAENEFAAIFFQSGQIEPLKGTGESFFLSVMPLGT